MAPPSIEYLYNYLIDKTSHSSTGIRCTQSSPEIQLVDLPWKAYLDIAVYAIKSGKIQEDVSISRAILYLDDRASELAVLKPKPHAYLRKEQEMYRVFTNYLKKYAEKYFSITLKSTENLSYYPTSNITNLTDFIGLLVKTLNCKQNPFLKRNHQSPFSKALKFLAFVSQDISVQHNYHPSVTNLMEEFVAVANEAGSFIYSSVFLATPVNLCIHVLYYKFHLLDAKIKDHCFQLTPMFPVMSTNPFDNLDALIISLEYLLALLKELMGCPIIEYFDDIKDHWKKLHGEVISVVRFLKVVKLPQHGEIEGVNECLILIRDVALETKFLIDSFMAESVPVWYMNLRLPKLFTKFEIIGKFYRQVDRFLHLRLTNNRGPEDSSQALQVISAARSSPGQLFRYFTENILSFTKEMRLSRNWKGWLAVLHYVLNYRKDSYLDHLLIGHLRYELFSELPMNDEKKLEIFDNFFMSFVLRAEKYFTMPKRWNVLASNNAKLLAGFINFLLQILTSESDHIQDQMQYAPIQNRLMFLLAVLGDIPFQQIDEHQGVQNLLKEFEIVANQAGNFIYIYFVGSAQLDGDILFYERMNTLVDNFDYLNAMIKGHCVEFSMLPATINPKSQTAAIDSIFIVESLRTDLDNLMNNRLNFIDDVKDEIHRLDEGLMSVRSFLKESNLPQNKEKHELRECLIQIRDLTYEAEYLINSFVVKILPAWYVKIRLPAVVEWFWGLLGKGFEQIKKSVNREIKEDCYKRAPLQAMVVDEKLFIGFDKERNQIRDELSNPSKTGRKIVGIIGMPGIGKTTLARKLYDDPFIIGYFDERAWCIVSQSYNKRRVLAELLEGLTSMPDKDSTFEKEDENVLLEVMHKTLKWRRYLIVIDDVWDSEFWDDFGRYFPDDGKGSRIVFTSRNIVGAPRESIIYQLPLMTEDQCWELLTKKLFPSEKCPEPLLKSGKRIAAKCNGLPLLVVLLAGILSKVGMEQSEWEVVELSLDSHTSKGMEIVELSYKHLPDHLKLCFLYLGVFPQGSEIQVQKLTWLWTAEGFIEKREEKSVEHVANEYLRNLIDRSLLLTTKNKSTGKAKACRVHNLVRDMCLRKVQEENFLTLVTADFFMSYNKHHRLCVSSTTQDYLVPFSMHCRSYFSNPSDTNLSLPQMKLLKVMELSWRWNYAHHFHRYMVPRIDQLIHLRYLVIDQLKDVPEQILGNLVNLEFLHVDSDSSFALPSAILNMEKLRHLLVKPYAEFSKHCSSIFQNKIESVETIEINNNEDFEILKGSPNLHKLKCRCLSLAHDFGFFISLQSLKISVPFYHLPHRDSNREIHLPAAIRKLSLDETRLPWEKMSILGKLPKLEVLKLRMHAFEGETWETIEGEFQNLRILKLIGLNLEEWSIESSEHFPKLERLVLNRCFKVQEIPIELGDITTLEMIEVYYCSTEVSDSALAIQEYQRDNGIEDLIVIIKNQRESNNETDNIREDFLDLEARGQTSKGEMMIDVFQRHSSRQGIRAFQLPPKELISALLNFEKSRRRGFRENWDAQIGDEVEYTIIDSGE